MNSLCLGRGGHSCEPAGSTTSNICTLYTRPHAPLRLVVSCCQPCPDPQPTGPATCACTSGVFCSPAGLPSPLRLGCCCFRLFAQQKLILVRCVRVAADIMLALATTMGLFEDVHMADAPSRGHNLGRLLFVGCKPTLINHSRYLSFDVAL